MDGVAPAKSFEDLIVWQRAHRLVLAVYGVTRSFPRHETYGLVTQLQRSAVSVPANVAEGFRRRGKADKLRFLNIVQGSLAESRYYLLLAQDLGYAETDPVKKDLEEVSRLLDSYAKAILTSIG